MRVLFVNPGGGYAHEYPPLGLLYLASFIRERGHETALFDEGAVRENASEGIIRKIHGFKPQVVCLSLYTTNIIGAYWLARLVKIEVPGTVVVCGGPHATALPERTMRECPEIDYLVIGEGEESLAELLQTIEDGNPVSDLLGVCRRNKDGTVRILPRRPLIRNLDTLPLPAYDLLSGLRYTGDPVRKRHTIGSIMTSRGCPFDCTFCNKAVFGSTYRRRSPESVVREIRLQQDVLGVEEIYFMDDLFATNRQWLNRLFEIMRSEGIRLPWKCLGRAGGLEEDDYRNMAEHGCHTVQFGVESGNQGVLDDIRKRLTLDQIREAFHLAGKAGLHTYGFFIAGHRLDTEDTIRQTLRFAEALAPDFIAFFCLVLFPGTHVFMHGPEEKYDWRRIGYVHWDRSRLPLSICSVDPERLAEFERQAYIEYYASTKYLFRIIGGYFRGKKGFSRKKIELFAYYLAQKAIDRIKRNPRVFDSLP